MSILIGLLLLPLFGGTPPHGQNDRRRSSQFLKSLAPSAAHDARLNAAYAALQVKSLTGAYRLSVLAEQRGARRSDVLSLQAQIFRDADYLDREMATLQQWTVLAPQDPLPWLKLFYIYLDLGWRHEAENASRKAYDRAPHNPRCFVARALLAYRSNNPSAGLPAIEMAQQLDPTNLDLKNLHAGLLMKDLRFRDAEVKLRHILKTEPQSNINRLALAQALLGQNKRSEAEALLRTLLQQEPNNVEAAFQSGLLAQHRHDLPEATRLFEKAAAIDLQYSTVMWNLGHLYIQQGRTEEGKKLLKLFSQMDTNESDFETLLKRLETRPNDISLHYHLARFHQGAGELSQAIVELRRVLQLHPTDSAARKDLAVVLARVGRATESRSVSVTRTRL